MAQHRSLQIDLKYGISTIYSPCHHFNSIETREYSVISFIVQLVGLRDTPCFAIVCKFYSGPACGWL